MKRDHYTVYSAYNRMVQFDGSYEECFDWIISQGEKLSDGSVIYRTWEMDGETYFDVGRVFILS